MRAFIVTEGPFDAQLLHRLLPSDLLENVQIAVAGGKVAAARLSESLLRTHRAPVALVIDADTTEPHRVDALRKRYRDLLASKAPGAPFDVFLAVPELEAVFFTDPHRLARTLGARIEPGEVEAARRRPKEVLGRLLGRSPLVGRPEDLVERLDDRTASGMATHELIRSLARYLAGPGQPDATSR